MIRRYAINYNNITSRKDINKEILAEIFSKAEKELKKKF